MPACFAAPPAHDPKVTIQPAFQAGLGLDWHYRLPFEPALSSSPTAGRASASYPPTTTCA
jgi:hypothetical protein